MNVVSLGIMLLIIGGVLLLAFFGLMWVVPRLRVHEQPADQIYPDQENLTENKEITVIIKPGGKLLYLNQEARKVFGLGSGEMPGLERLAQRVRPSEQFLSLAATESQARLVLFGHQMEATSHWIKIQDNPVMLMIIRPETTRQHQAGAENAGPSDIRGPRIADDITGNQNEINDLDSTLKAILIYLDTLLPCDFTEISIWNSGLEILNAYRLGGTTGGDRWLDKTQEIYKLNEGMAGYVAFTKEGIRIPHINKGQETIYFVKQPQASFISFLGIPLILNNHLVGTLAFASTVDNYFHEETLETAQSVAANIALLIQNGLLMDQKRHQNVSIDGIAQLSNVLSSVIDPKNLYTQLVHSLAPLIPVQVLGFLIYNETERVLEGKVPFQGVPPQFVEMYRVTVLPNHVVEKALLEKRVIISENASEDLLWEELGMQHLAQAASIRDAILQPLYSSGRTLGYLQAANHTNGTTFFTPEERQLILIAANQSASMIENAQLTQQSRIRAQRSEMLRRISNMVSTATNPDDLIRLVLRELNHHLRLDVAAVFLVDSLTSRLNLHAPSMITAMNPSEKNKSLLVDDPQFLFTVTGSQHSSFYNHLSEENALIPFYRQLVGDWRAESAIVVPLAAGDENIGEMWLASMEPEHFEQNDMQLTAVIAAEIAGVIRQHRLSSLTDFSLREQLNLIVTMGQIDRELDATLEIDPLLQILYDEALKLSGADCGQIIYFGPHQKIDTVHPSILITKGDPHPGNLSDIEREVLNSQQAKNIVDITAVEGYPGHEGIASAIVLPIISQQKNLALLILHSKAVNYFFPIHEVLQTLITHAATSLENTLRFDEVINDLKWVNEELVMKDRLIQIGQTLRPNRPLQEALNDICSVIQSATPFQSINISIYDAATKLVRRISQGGIGVPALDFLNDHPRSWQIIQSLLKPEYKVGRIYTVPADLFMPLPAKEHPGLDMMPGTENDEIWDENDIVLLPLYTADKTPLGLISMGAPQNGKRPSRATLKALDLYSIQVSMIVDNNRYITALASSLSEVEANYNRLMMSSSGTQKHITMLLHNELEEVLLNRTISRELEHAQMLPEIIEATNQQQNPTSLLKIVAEAILYRFGFQAGLIAQRNRNQINIMDVVGSLPANSNPEAWMGQHNPLRQVLLDGSLLMVEHVQEDEANWQQSPMIKALGSKSFIALPFLIDPEHIMAILLTSEKPVPSFSENDRRIFIQLIRQVVGRLQSLALLSETIQRLDEVRILLDFTQKLNQMGISETSSQTLSRFDPEQILYLLLESVMSIVKSTQSGWIGLWDSAIQGIIPSAVIGFADGDSLRKIVFKEVGIYADELLPIQVFRSGIPFRVDEVRFSHDYLLPADDLIAYRKATNQQIPESSMLIPFRQGDKIAGLLVLDNYDISAAFTEQDEIMVQSLVNQAILALENARLFEESRLLLLETQKRTEELAYINNIGQGLAKQLDVLSIISLVGDQLRNIFHTQEIGIRLYDDKTRLLTYPYEFEHGQRLSLTPSDIFDTTVSRYVIENRIPLVGNANVIDQMFGDRVNIPGTDKAKCMVSVPIISGDSVMGLVLIENYESFNAFGDADVRLLQTLASSMGVALENARLFYEAEQRTDQLQYLTQISGIMGSSLNSQELIDLMLGQLRRIVPFNTATLWMREEDDLVIASANGFVDTQSRVGLKVNGEDSVLFKEMLRTGDVILVPDIRKDERFPSLLEPENMCWMGIPLIEKSEVKGMIALEKKEVGYYTVDQVQISKAFASQTMIALENARLFEQSENRSYELDLRTQRLSLLNQLSADLGSLLDVETILRVTSQQLMTALSMTSVAAIMLDNDQNVLKVELPVTRLTRLPLPLPQIPLLDRMKETLGIYAATDMGSEEEIAPLYNAYLSPRGVRSILIIPLATAVQVYGWLMVQNNVSHRFNIQEIELARTMSNQAAIAIQNATLLNETRQLSADLERRVIERTAELQREHQYTEALLRITTELSSSLELEQILGNTLRILNDSLGAEQSMILMSDGTSRHYDAGTTMIDLRRAAGQHFAFQPDQELVNIFLRHHDAILIKDTRSEMAIDFPNKENMPFRSAIATPLLLTDQIMGTLLLINRHPNVFNEDHVKLAQAAARQISVAMNNAELYEISTDQSNRLIDMLRNQEIASSRSIAILEAVADGVLVTDSENIITLFNKSAQFILDLTSGEGVGKSLDQFFNFFGKVAESWMKTIQTWSANPHSYQAGDSYSEQLNLSNNRVILVSLAPVIMGETFLGTVSIFRDITHQIQVDRLKSEFVANVSHELRTPMTSIKGYVDILLMGAAGEITPQQGQFLQVVKTNTERLGVLVNDLLDVSKIEGGRAVLSHQAVNMVDIATELINEISNRSADVGKHMTILSSFPFDLPKVRGDRERIRQVFGNLINNAFNYTPAGGEIKIQMQIVEDMVQIDVIDNGIGISFKDQRRIFERFYRGEDSLVLATAGTGLGLAMSKILVDMHGGRIWFTSTGVPGEGSIFSFTLPIYKAEE
jgi:GAF domain-containing protein/nitrogen-specific signal transduction histidine kinase